MYARWSTQLLAHESQTGPPDAADAAGARGDDPSTYVVYFLRVQLSTRPPDRLNFEALAPDSVVQSPTFMCDSPAMNGGQPINYASLSPLLTNRRRDAHDVRAQSFLLLFILLSGQTGCKFGSPGLSPLLTFGKRQ